MSNICQLYLLVDAYTLQQPTVNLSTSEKGNLEAANDDLAVAAACGSTLAIMATTSTNPYASMCQAAVAKMLEVPQTTT